MWLKNLFGHIFSKQGGVTLVLLLVVVYLTYHFMKAREHSAAQADKKRPKQELAQEAPKIPVNQAVAQPAIVLSTGAGVDYRPAAVPAPTIGPLPIVEATPQPEVEDLPPMVLCDFAPPPPKPAPTPTPAPKAVILERWLPRGVYFRCQLVCGLSSSHMDTPVQVKVMEDVYQWDYGRAELIVPAGTLCSCFATQGYTRDSIEVKGNWIMMFPDKGTELEFTGILCEQQYDPRYNHFGKFDKNAGIKGILIESDYYVRLKAAVGLVFKTVTDSATSFASSAASTFMHGGTSVSYNVPSVSPFTDELINQLINGHHTQINDTLYVWVAPGHNCWMFTTSIINPSVASIGARIQEEEKARKQKEEQQEQRSQSPLDPAVLKKLIQAANPQQPTEQQQLTNETPPVSAAHFN